MTRYREPSICIRTTDYSETSQVVHFFTRGSGVVRLLAKGTKRPKSKSGGMIDLLAEGELIFSGTGRETLGTLIEFSETVSHTPLRRDGRRLNAALYMLELVGEMFAEGDVHAEAFDLLHNSLSRLGQEGSPVAAVLAYFQWRLLGHAGLLGDLTACVGCGLEILSPTGEIAANGATPESPTLQSPIDNLCSSIEDRQSTIDNRPSVWFSSRQGGLLCAACQAKAPEKYRVDRPALLGLGVLLAVSAGRRTPLPDDQAKSVNRLLAYHISQQLAKRLRMAKHAID